MPTTVNGECHPRFAAVGDVFAASFAKGRELGGAVSVVAGGKVVVDLWAGTADHRSGRAWEQDTPCLAFSCVKAVTAACALLLAERGQLDLDAPVATYWPEFAGGSKESVTTRHLLAHRVGAGQRARVPRVDVRLAGRRGRAPGLRPHAGHVRP
jgi:CubicO group peptidase (beta-lactamase class C family)